MFKIIRKLRSYIADLKHKVFFFFHGYEVALTSHICFPIRLVFHQHLNSHVAYLCGLKVRVGCQDRLRVNSDADETLA